MQGPDAPTDVTPVGTEPEPTNGPTPSRRRRHEALTAAGVAALAVAVAAWVLQLWDASLLSIPLEYVHVPTHSYVYGADAPFYLMLAKGGIDNVWFFTNQYLGAPGHQQLYDLPHGLDNLHLLVLKVLGLLTGNVAATVNLFLLLTFASVAAAAYLVTRALRVSRGVAVLVSVLYAVLPYHFLRGTPHLLLSSYAVVPLGAYLVVRIVSGDPPFTAPADTARGWKLRIWDRSGILWLLACVALASSGAYYAAFTLLFVASIALIDYIARRRRRVLASAGAVLVALLAVVVFNLAPTVLYWAANGANETTVQRGPGEAEREGLKVAQLLIPVPDHRIPLFADAQTDSQKFTPTRSEAGQNLGVLGVIGFVGVLGALLVAARVRRGDDDEREATDEEHDPVDRREVLRTFGVLSVVGIVVAVVGGWSILFFGVGIRELRSWNRIVVYLAFFGFVALAYGLDWLRARLPDRPWRTPVVVLALVALGLLGVLDQTTSEMVPHYASTRARWDSDADLVAKIERDLPDDAMVFQLPYRFFPEARAIDALGPYDLVRGYLHSDSLRWSWGGMRGRGADWPVHVLRHPVDGFLDRIVAIGFQGLLLDRSSMYFGGSPSEESLVAELGRPMPSPDGELAYWDLRQYRADLRDRIGADGMAELAERALADDAPIPEE